MGRGSNIGVCPTCGVTARPQGLCFYCWQDEQDDYEDWKDIGRDFNYE